MKEKDIMASYTILEGQNLIKALCAKLMEESLEVTQATNQKEIAEELADVLAVIDALRQVHGISQAIIAEAKEKKYQQKGGFQRGVFIKKIEMAEDNPWVAHFRAEPDKNKEE